MVTARPASNWSPKAAPTPFTASRMTLFEIVPSMPASFSALATVRPRFTYNQFGANLGGPIWRDKTFFFLNYEGRRQSQGVILQGLIPTQEMLAGDFSGTGKTIRDPLNNNNAFPNNVIPQARWDPISKQLLQYFPLPNIVRPGANFLATPSDIERRDQGTMRIDHHLTDKLNLFGRYSYATDDLGNAAYITNLGVIRPDRTHFLVIGLTDVISAQWISETRLGFTKTFLARVSDGDTTSTNYAAQLGLKNLAANPGDYTLPNINLSGYAPGTPGASSGFVGYGTHIVQNNLYYRAAETLTWIKGSHTLKMGADVNRLMVGYDQGSSQNGVFNFGGTFTGDSFADFLLGYPLTATGGLGSVGDFGGVAKYSIGTQYNAFLQDDWKINSRLTLNLGLRYEIFQQWRGRLANFDPATGRQLLANSPDYFVPGQGLVKGSGAALLPERPVQTDANNWSPRLGIAYRARKQDDHPHRSRRILCAEYRRQYSGADDEHGPLLRHCQPDVQRHHTATAAFKPVPRCGSGQICGHHQHRSEEARRLRLSIQFQRAARTGERDAAGSAATSATRVISKLATFGSISRCFLQIRLSLSIHRAPAVPGAFAGVPAGDGLSVFELQRLLCEGRTAAEKGTLLYRVLHTFEMRGYDRSRAEHVQPPPGAGTLRYRRAKQFHRQLRLRSAVRTRTRLRYPQSDSERIPGRMGTQRNHILHFGIPADDHHHRRHRECRHRRTTRKCHRHPAGKTGSADKRTSRPQSCCLQCSRSPARSAICPATHSEALG